MRVIFAALFLLLGIAVARADTAALSGTVSSAAEGKMEGVLVSATKSDNTITVTVVSDAEGRYRFPDTKLPPGQYTLDIRAIGYVLGHAPSIDVTTGKSAQADLSLINAPDLAASSPTPNGSKACPAATRTSARCSNARVAIRSSASSARRTRPMNSHKC